MAGNASETTINTAGVYELVAGVFVGGGVGVEFTESATNGRLTYTGTPDRHMHVVSNFDMTCASNNQVLAFQWFKNGVALPVPVERKVSTGTDIGAASLHADVHLATGDYLELKVANLTSNANVTMKNVCLFVMGMLA